MVKQPRKCEICDKGFDPMTDKQWEIVKDEHEKLSHRHKDYLGLKK